MKKTNANVGTFAEKEFALNINLENPVEIKPIDPLKEEYKKQIIHINNVYVEAIENNDTELAKSVKGLLEKINKSSNYKTVLDNIYKWSYKNYNFIDKVFGVFFITGGREMVDEGIYCNKIRRTPETIKNEIDYMNAKTHAEKTVEKVLSVVREDKHTSLRSLIYEYEWSEDELEVLFNKFETSEVYNKKVFVNWFGAEFCSAIHTMVKYQTFSKNFIKKHAETFKKTGADPKTKKAERGTKNHIDKWFGDDEKNDERFNELKEYDEKQWKNIMKDERDIVEMHSLPSGY